MAKRLFEADIEAPSFVKKGGLATQYLKADGSVDFGQRQIHNHVEGLLLLTGAFRTKTVILGTATPTAATQPIEIQIEEDACEAEDTLHIIATQFSGRIVFSGAVEYIFNGTRTSVNFQINVGDEVWLKAIEQNLFTIAVTRLQQAIPPPSLFQRPVKFITTATYDFITADKDKSLVVTSEDAITSINLNQNTFAVNDEIELYDKTDGHKTRIYPGAGITIFNAGQTYINGQYFDFGTYQKIWLKCTDVNKFDIVYVDANDGSSGGGSSTWGAITGTLSSQTDLQNALNAKVDKIITTNRQTASYTLALTDANKLVEMNVATANNLTVPPNASVAFPIGTPIDISQYGAGITTIVAGSGVTIRSANNWFKMNAQYAGASIVKIGTNEWYLFGNLNA